MKQYSLLDFADSDSDDNFGARIIVSRLSEKMAPARQPRNRTAQIRIAKAEPKTATRRAGARKAAAAEKEIERLALDDEPEEALLKATKRRKTKKPAEEHNEDDEVLATPPGSDEPTRKKAARGRPKKQAVVPDSVQKKDAPSAAKKGRKPAKVPVEDDPSEIPETQPAEDPMDVDGEEEDQVEDLPTFSRYSVPPSAQRKGSYQIPPSASKRAVSTTFSDDESGSSTRRRLAELTKKHEVLEAKYRDLKNVAVTEAEKTFDRLQKASEERAQASKLLIASLKADLVAQKQLAIEGHKSQQRLESSEAKVDSLEAQVTEVTRSLDEARTQIKTLTTRLNASRAAEATSTAQAQAANARVPGSAIKPGAMGARGLDLAQVQATQTAKMKENLYSDLTGLVLTSVKRDGPEDVYNCIQTGRNGTLHFKLAIANENSDENLDEAEFMYKPQLDERRDAQLIEILPDFLVEEITFPRPHAAKFYARVLKSLTEKLEE